MDNDKNMCWCNTFYRFAEHYGIENARDISFKNVSYFFESLKINNEGARQVIDSLFCSLYKNPVVLKTTKKKFDQAVCCGMPSMPPPNTKSGGRNNACEVCRENKIAIGGIEAEAWACFRLHALLFLPCCLYWFTATCFNAQIFVEGFVRDAATGEPVPFALLV